MNRTAMIITPTAINETYESCRLRRHESRTETIAVRPFLATSHAFHKKRLARSASFVICALKKLPKTLRRSCGCEGQPWIVSRHILSQDKDYALDVMDRLLAMAVGLDMVSVSIPEGAPSDMPYIVIEDERIIRQCKLTRNIKGTIWQD